jgi:hypothetical protein
MKLSIGFSILLLCACLLSSSQPHARTPIVITPFDEYGNICWEDEQARLDNFSIQLHNDPALVGYIVVYAGRMSCSDEAKYRGNRARSHVLKRGVDPKRVVFKDGGYRPDIQTVLHLQPKDKPDYEVKPTLSKDEVSIKRCRDKVFARVLCLNKQ